MLPNKKYIFQVIKKRPPDEYATRNLTSKKNDWNDFKPFKTYLGVIIYHSNSFDGIKLKYKNLILTFDKREI